MLSFTKAVHRSWIRRNRREAVHVPSQLMVGWSQRQRVGRLVSVFWVPSPSCRTKCKTASTDLNLWKNQWIWFDSPYSFQKLLELAGMPLKDNPQFQAHIGEDITNSFMRVRHPRKQPLFLSFSSFSRRHVTNSNEKRAPTSMVFTHSWLTIFESMSFTGESRMTND